MAGLVVLQRLLSGQLLQTGKIAGQSSISVREPTTEADVPITGKPPASIEFTDHIRVLDYIRSGNFKPNRELEEALDKYYSCLDYGGRVYNTPSMPENFSSVWLLAKVLPKHVHHKERITNFFTKDPLVSFSINDRSKIIGPQPNTHKKTTI